MRVLTNGDWTHVSVSEDGDLSSRGGIAIKREDNSFMGIVVTKLVDGTYIVNERWIDEKQTSVGHSFNWIRRNLEDVLANDQQQHMESLIRMVHVAGDSNDGFAVVFSKKELQHYLKNNEVSVEKEANTITARHFYTTSGGITKIDSKDYTWHIPKAVRPQGIEVNDIVRVSSSTGTKDVIVTSVFREDIEDTGRRYKCVLRGIFKSNKHNIRAVEGK